MTPQSIITHHGEAVGVRVEIRPQGDNDVGFDHLPDRRRRQAKNVGGGWQNDGNRT